MMLHGGGPGASAWSNFAPALPGFAADGADVYLPATDNLRVPLMFLHGEHNRLFKPEGSQLTYDHLVEKNGPDLYSRTVVPEYAHMDLFVGKDAARDVYPLLAADLDRFN